MKWKTFSEKQLRVMTWWLPSSEYTDCDAIICDGAVRSGKTACMFVSFLIWALTTFPGGNFAVCSKTVTSLRRNIITPMTSAVSQFGITMKEISSRGKIEVSMKNRSIVLWTFGGKDEASASLIQGMTLCGVLLDEVALMPRSFVEQAIARCSVEGSKLWFNCNPESPNHWFYNEWIKKAKDKKALYLHFTMRDNPSLSREMIERYNRLYTGHFYERYIEGKWVAAEGLVYPQFSERNIYRGEVPRVESYYISCDYGTVNPSSFGLWGFANGVWYRMKEYYYDSKREGSQKTDEEYYCALRNLAANRKIGAVICDPSAASFITLIRKKGEFRVIPAKNDVIDGIRRVSDAISGGKIKICDRCTDSIREFGIYRWEEGGRDMPKKENDHAMDDIRYFVSTVLYKNSLTRLAGSASR